VAILDGLVTLRAARRADGTSHGRMPHPKAALNFDQPALTTSMG